MLELLKLLLSIFTRTKATESVAPSAQPNPAPAQPSPPVTPKEDIKMEIDWTNPAAKISKYFTVKEALWCPQWKVCHIPSEEEKVQILKTAEKMDIVREFLGKPISIHCWLRPGSLNNPDSPHHGQDYNALVKGAKRSAHKFGQGVDFSSDVTPEALLEDCNEIRRKLLPKLEELDMRMEDIEGPWVHLDTYDKSVSGGQRFFKP